MTEAEIIRRMPSVQQTHILFQSDLQEQLHSIKHVELSEVILVFCNHGLADGSTWHFWVEIHVVLIEAILLRHSYRKHICSQLDLSSIGACMHNN